MTAKNLSPAFLRPGGTQRSGRMHVLTRCARFIGGCRHPSPLLYAGVRVFYVFPSVQRIKHVPSLSAQTFIGTTHDRSKWSPEGGGRGHKEAVATREPKRGETRQARGGGTHRANAQLAPQQLAQLKHQRRLSATHGGSPAVPTRAQGERDKAAAKRRARHEEIVVANKR